MHICTLEFHTNNIQSQATSASWSFTPTISNHDEHLYPGVSHQQYPIMRHICILEFHTNNIQSLDTSAPWSFTTKISNHDAHLYPGVSHQQHPITRHICTLEFPTNTTQLWSTSHPRVLFKQKSLWIIYKCTCRKHPDPNIYINNVKVPCVNDIIHLGHNLNGDIFKFNSSKCDFNRQCAMYFVNFKYANSNIRKLLFHKYCTAFYGNQHLPMFNGCMESSYMQSMRVLWTTHCKLLPHLANCMDIIVCFSRSCMRFIKMVRNS